MFSIMMMPAIPSPVQTLLDLFATSLAEVRFADLDGPALARLATEVEVAASEVADAQAALDVAREVLQAKQDTLVQQAQRALAYARVFAENDETLSARLDAISLPRATRRPRSEDALVLSAEPQPAPRPRGRPRKIRPVEDGPTPIVHHGAEPLSTPPMSPTMTTSSPSMLSVSTPDVSPPSVSTPSFSTRDAIGMASVTVA